MFFAVFWIKSFLYEKKIMRFFFLLPVFMIVYQAAAFFLFYDFGRWMIMVLTIQFMLIFYFVYVQDSTIISVLQKLAPFVAEFWFVILLAFFLMTFLGPVNQIAPSRRVTHIAKGILQLMKIKFL
jgi:hypothetical protein